MNYQNLKKYIINEKPITNEVFENFFDKDNKFELSEPVILESQHAFDVYSNRFVIQETITKSNIFGYEKLLENLKKEEKEIFIYQIYTEIGFISCFFNNKENKLLGVLWNPNKKKE